jgi:putative spermidine/putrescine transport system permease protein
LPAYARPPGAADPRAPGGAGLALRRFGAVPALAGLALFLLLPLAALLVEAVAGGAGLWGRLVADPLFGPAVRRTVALGAATATLSLAAGLLLARAVARLGARARQVMTVLLGVPLTFSGLVIAYGLILAYGRAGFVTLLAARAGADPAVVGAWIYSTAGLVFAYAYYLVPRVTLILVPLFVNLDRRPVEAALTLGARPWRAWADTAGRELAPTLAAVWCLVCAIAMGTYGTALALAGTQVNILPLLLYMKVSDSGSDFPLAAALSIVLLGLCTVVLALGEALSGVRDRQAGSP